MQVFSKKLLRNYFAKDGIYRIVGGAHPPPVAGTTHPHPRASGWGLCARTGTRTSARAWPRRAHPRPALASLARAGVCAPVPGCTPAARTAHPEGAACPRPRPGTARRVPPVLRTAHRSAQGHGLLALPTLRLGGFAPLRRGGAVAVAQGEPCAPPTAIKAAR